MRQILRYSLLFSLISVLVACGGGGSDNVSNQSNNVTATDSEVIAYLKSSNIDFSSSNRLPGTWRWPSTPTQRVYVYIPTPTVANSTQQEYATKAQNAIGQINSKLTGLVIVEALSAVPSSGQYIQVSYDTSYVPPNSTDFSSYCANVSTSPNVGNVIQPSTTNGIATSPVFINLGNGRCNVTQDIVTHEFAHALGLASHFNGFGNGPAISAALWDVLATLYSNPQATVASNIIVKRAAN